MTLIVNLFPEGIDPTRPCCTATVNNCCHLLLGLDPSAQRSCLSATVKVCLSGICFLQHSLLSCLEKMLIKKEIELPKVNYCGLWLSLDSRPIVDVITVGRGGRSIASIL